MGRGLISKNDGANKDPSVDRVLTNSVDICIVERRLFVPSATVYQKIVTL